MHVYLFNGSFDHDSHARWHMAEGSLEEARVRDLVLFKAIQEWSWGVFHLRLLNNNHTLEVRVDSRWFEVSSNGNVGVVAWALFRIVNASETLVEQIVEALVNVVSLTHDDCMTFDGRVTNCRDGVDLLELAVAGKVAANIHSRVIPLQHSKGKKQPH